MLSDAVALGIPLTFQLTNPDWENWAPEDWTAGKLAELKQAQEEAKPDPETVAEMPPDTPPVLPPPSGTAKESLASG